MKNTILATVVILLALFGIFYFLDRDDGGKSGGSFTDCLVESGMVVYGSKTCPACKSLADKFGGYEAMGELFVSCGEDDGRCSEEMQTQYVPEVQINGELFTDGRELEDFAKATGCEL